MAAQDRLNALDYTTIIIGAGISGIGAGISLDKYRLGSFCILEKESELGGTWRDNRYPGVAVDILSFSYSYSFEMNPNWSRLYSPGAEIQEYVQHCAKKYRIREHIRFNAAVAKAVFSEQRNDWEVYLHSGEMLRCRYLISATGILNQPVLPDIPGLDSFAGTVMHTGRWDSNIDLSGRRVGVIGTGASAVQVVPSIAAHVKHLNVYQRTPIWVAPKFDFALPDSVHNIFQRVPGALRAARWASELALQIATFAVVNYRRLPFMTAIAERQCSRFLHSQVRDPTLREKLQPRYGFGCKRPAISNDYLKTFTRENVSLVTEGIREITPRGIVTHDGHEHPLDVLILATGFKTLELGNSPSYDVLGVDGLELGRFWHEHRYQAYQGVAVPGFPNYFLTFGPYTGGFNWFAMLETHLRLIVRSMHKAKKLKATRVEVSQQAHDRYFEQMLARSQGTVFKDAACVSAHSYYLDHHGDASAPAPVTPWWRWLTMRVTPLRGFQFRS